MSDELTLKFDAAGMSDREIYDMLHDARLELEAVTPATVHGEEAIRRLIEEILVLQAGLITFIDRETPPA